MNKFLILTAFASLLFIGSAAAQDAAPAAPTECQASFADLQAQGAARGINFQELSPEQVMTIREKTEGAPTADHFYVMIVGKAAGIVAVQGDDCVVGEMVIPLNKLAELLGQGI